MILLLPNDTLKLLQCHSCLNFHIHPPFQSYFIKVLLVLKFIFWVFLHPLDENHSFQHHIDGKNLYVLIQINSLGLYNLSLLS